MSKRHDTALRAARRLRDQLAACALGGFADHTAASELVTALDAFIPVRGHSLTADELSAWTCGHKVAAIKAVRARTGLGLAESRALCELLGGGE